MIDWKTGAGKYGTKDQDNRSAWFVFAHYPEVKEIYTRWIFLKDGSIVKRTFTRDDEPELRKSTDDLTNAIEQSRREGKWPTKPGPLCSWCAVGKAGLCAEFGKTGRRR